MLRLTFSPNELNLVLEPGQVLDGHISVSRGGGSFEGAAIASGIGMVCREARFDDRTGMIPWRFQAGGFMEGDTADGWFRIISDHGEYRIPYHVLIGTGASGMEEKILSLEAFAALAEEDWDKALAFFYSRRFSEIPMSDHEAALYACLSAEKDSSYNMEQFLTAACGKIPASLRPSVDRIETELTGRGAGGRSQRIRFTLSRWGYGRTRMEVRAFPEFLELKKTLLTEEDFEEDQAEIACTIVESCLHAGRNLGRIQVRCGRSLQEIPVCVVRGRRDPSAAMTRRALQHARLQLMRILEAYGAGTMTAAQLEAAARPCIDKLEIYDRKRPDARLWRIWLNQETGRSREAEKDLEALRTALSGRPGPPDPDRTFAQYRGEDDMRYSARLFLMARQNRTDKVMVPRIVRILRDRYRRDQSNWALGWLFMKLEPEYGPGTDARWNFLRRQFERGTASPILYMEAWNMAARDPARLFDGTRLRAGRQAGDSWTIQLFRYGVRRGRISPETGERLLAYAEALRDSDRVLVRTLLDASRLEVLAGIRTALLRRALQMMIDLGACREKDFAWYREGIGAGLRLPLLFPMTLQSMPLSGGEALPGDVVREMVEAGDLSYEQRARLYLYLYENRDSLPGLFDSSRRLIRAFIRQQLAAGRMSGALSRLYRAALTDPVIQPEDADGLPEAACTCLTEADVPEADRILVRYDQFRGTRTTAAPGGTCRVLLYGTDLCLLAGDHKGNRTVLDLSAADRAGGDFPDAARMLEGHDPVYEAMRAGLSLTEPLVTDRTLPAALALLKDQNLLPVPRERLFAAILSYYKEEGDSRRILHLLDGLDKPAQEAIWNGRSRDQVLICAAAADHPAVLRLLKGAGRNRMSEEAFTEILLSALRQTGDRHDPVLGELCYDALTEGIREEAVFAYAGRSFMGLSRELDALRRLWKENGGDTARLLVREAEQLSFSGASIPGMEDLLLSLEGQEGLPEAAAFSLAASCAGDLLVRDLPGDPALLPLMEAAAGFWPEDPRGDQCRTLYLKSFAEGRGGDRDRAAVFLGSLLDRQIRLPFFEKLRDLDCRMESYLHETLLVWPAPEEGGEKHYVLHALTGAGEEAPSLSSLRPHPFREILPGLYMASFLLFGAETVFYTITEDPEEISICARGRLGRREKGPSGEKDRYSLVDRMQAALDAGRKKEAIELLKEYYITDRIVRKLFEEGSEGL